MSGGFPDMGSLCNGTIMGGTVSSGSNSGVIVNPSATANTKGAWTQIISSTASDFSVLLIQLDWASGTSFFGAPAVDIGVGAAAAEQVVISNLACNFVGAFGAVHASHICPIIVPAGTRISARSQCNAASVTNSFGVSIIGFDSSFSDVSGFSGIDSIGYNAASSQGTSIVSASGTKGSWTQLSASTPRDYEGIFALFDSGTASNSDQFIVDIGVGAGGSEITIVPNWALRSQEGSQILPLLEISIPAGTRIAARMADVSPGTPTVGLTVYGVYK